jgi:hypothetical protein
LFVVPGAGAIGLGFGTHWEQPNLFQADMDFSNIAITKLANKAVDDGRHWTERLRWQQYEQLQQEEQRDDYDDMLSGASCIEMKGDTTNNNEHNNTKSQICDEMHAIRQRVNQRSSKVSALLCLLFSQLLCHLSLTCNVHLNLST